MRRYHNILVALMLAAFSACSDSQLEGWEPFLSTGQQATPVSVDQRSITVESTSTSAVVNVTASGQWTAASGSDWITLSTSSGIGDGSITLTIAENKTPDLRTGTVAIQNSAGSVNVTVSQNGKTLTISPESLSFEADGGTETVTVTADGAFSATTDDSWITILASDNKISVTATVNTKTHNRTGSVTVSLSNLTSGSLIKTINVMQNARGSMINGHEYVDLGLPSGTLWATCNIGATKPEEYGGYYAWGETEEKEYYDWSTYTHCDGTAETLHDIGNYIGGTEYDVAHVKWGGLWRMPSGFQIEELRVYCSYEWTSQNGINGTLVIGPNGNTLFLPAAGLRLEDNTSGVGSGGFYQISNYVKDAVFSIDHFWFINLLSDLDIRAWGLSVRAVCPGEPQEKPVADAIDLGLPSGTKWANWNIGAYAPEEFGDFYAWGEIETKDYYEWSNYTHCDGTAETCHFIGDNIAGTEYDVAHIKWGGSWQMPTKDQFSELINNCIIQYINGTNNLLFTGPNGNSIILPCGDWCCRAYNIYWTSSFDTDNDSYVFYGYAARDFRSSPRYRGFAVRAVCP